MQFLTKEYAKELLKDSPLLEASYEVGLSGSSRLYDLFVHCEAMTPGEYKLQGKGLTIHYGFYPSPFGKCFIATTDRGICSLVFLDQVDEKKVLSRFFADWKNAKLQKDQALAKDRVEQVFGLKTSKNPIHVLCRGTNFQIKVWEALLKIPPGKVVTYKALAQIIGRPQSVRAVGNAVGKNPIAYVIPCHRVIRSVGYFGGYRWGVSRKRAILGMEAAAETKEK